MSINRYVVKEIIQDEFLYEIAFHLRKYNIAADYYLQGQEEIKSLQSTRKQDKEDYMIRQLRLLVPYFWNGRKYKKQLSMDEKHKVEQIWRDFHEQMNHVNTSTLKPGLAMNGRPHYNGIYGL